MDKVKNVVLSHLKNGTPVCEIHFPYSLFNMGQIRKLEGRNYHPEGNYWTCAVTLQNIEDLKSFGYQIDSAIENILNRANVKIRDVEPLEIRGLSKSLYTYQKVGVSLIEARNGRVLLADEMGLGKTLQALAWLHYRKKLRPAVVVCPASLKLNWIKEARELIPDVRIMELSGNTTYSLSGFENQIIVINYDILDSWANEIDELQPKVLIMDEVHYIKNNTAKRTKAVKKIGKKIDHIIGISGTPILNRPVEIYNCVSLVDPTLLGSYYEFIKRYCDADYSKRNRSGEIDASGSSNTQELHQKLVKTIMIRRLKKDVLKELPSKRTVMVPIELSNMDEYRRAEKDFIQYILEMKGDEAAKRAKKAQAIVKINTLKQLCGKGKMEATIEWIENFINSGEKLVCFCTHIVTIDILTKHFHDISVRYDGTISLIERQKAVERFQKDKKTQLFFGMIDKEGRPSGVGITLTAASSTATIEYQWSPLVHDQADDRVHRIGQKEAVTNYKLMAAGTIEEKIAEILEKKRSIINTVIDGHSNEGFSILDDLLEIYF